jgi:hypothetical protein
VTASDISAALQERAVGILNDLGDGQFVRVGIDNEKALRSTTGSGAAAAGAPKPAIPEQKESEKQQISMISHGHGGEGEGVDAAVAPGQMIRHYAPDVPTYIVSRTSSSVGDRSQLQIIGGEHSPVVNLSDDALGDPISIRSSFVIDFGGRLSSYRSRCAVYEDLSPTGNTAEACEQVFRVLRYTESEEVRVRGVATVLLPDLRDAAQDDELLRALWERLHRAASGTFAQ